MKLNLMNGELSPSYEGLTMPMAANFGQAQCMGNVPTAEHLSQFQGTPVMPEEFRPQSQYPGPPLSENLPFNQPSATPHSMIPPPPPPPATMNISENVQPMMLDTQPMNLEFQHLQQPMPISPQGVGLSSTPGSFTLSEFQIAASQPVVSPQRNPDRPGPVQQIADAELNDDHIVSSEANEPNSFLSPPIQFPLKTPAANTSETDYNHKKLSKSNSCPELNRLTDKNSSSEDAIKNSFSEIFVSVRNDFSANFITYIKPLQGITSPQAATSGLLSRRKSTIPPVVTVHLDSGESTTPKMPHWPHSPDATPGRHGNSDFLFPEMPHRPHLTSELDKFEQVKSQLPMSEPPMANLHGEQAISLPEISQNLLVGSDVLTQGVEHLLGGKFAEDDYFGEGWLFQFRNESNLSLPPPPPDMHLYPTKSKGVWQPSKIIEQTKRNPNSVSQNTSQPPSKMDPSQTKAKKAQHRSQVATIPIGQSCQEEIIPIDRHAIGGITPSTRVLLSKAPAKVTAPARPCYFDKDMVDNGRSDRQHPSQMSGRYPINHENRLEKAACYSTCVEDWYSAINLAIYNWHRAREIRDVYTFLSYDPNFEGFIIKNTRPDDSISESNSSLDNYLIIDFRYSSAEFEEISRRMRTWEKVSWPKSKSEMSEDESHVLNNLVFPAYFKINTDASIKSIPKFTGHSHSVAPSISSEARIRYILRVKKAKIMKDGYSQTPSDGKFKIQQEEFKKNAQKGRNLLTLLQNGQSQNGHSHSSQDSRSPRLPTANQNLPRRSPCSSPNLTTINSEIESSKTLIPDLRMPFLGISETNIPRVGFKSESSELINCLAMEGAGLEEVLRHLQCICFFLMIIIG